MDWIENEEIIGYLKNKSINKFLDLGDRVCYSNDFQYCLLIRNHKSWEINGEGWRDANYSPQKNEKGRLILNFYKYNKDNDGSSWFKIFIPKKYAKIELKNIDDKYKIVLGKKELIGEFKNHFFFMRNFLTGFAESENTIEDKFEKINTAHNK